MEAQTYLNVEQGIDVYTETQEFHPGKEK